MGIETVAVLGAGQMGRGIAQVAAQGSRQVLLADIDLATAEAGRQKIITALGRQVDKGRMSAEDRDVTVERIRAVGDLAPFAEAGIVIEAATENEDLKMQLFRRLDEAAAPGAILASNTSSISITRLATATGRPQQVIGMHFMNPVPVMKLVEVIRGIATDDATYQATLALAEDLGKIMKRRQK